MRAASGLFCFQRFSLGLTLLALTAAPAFAQITHNLEIIWQKSYVDGAAPDSLWSWGRSIASAGDVNGDGFDDIIVGADTRGGGPWLARAYIFHGGPSMDTVPDVILTGAGMGTMVVNVSSVGDFNADDTSDVIVASDDGLDRVKIFFGGSPMDTIADLVLQPGSGGLFGCSVAHAGDVNGDSHDDCIVGAYFFNSGVGRAYIYFGGPSADNLPDVILNGDSADPSNFGWLVAGGKNVNGDGYDDIFVSANWPSLADGITYIYYGGSPFDTTPDVIMRGTRPGDFFGDEIALLADLENDGYDEAAVGDFVSATHDTVFVYFGSDPMDSIADVVLDGDNGSYFGASVAGIGSADTAGYGDLFVGVPLYGTDDRGQVCLYLGSDSFSIGSDASAEGGYPGQELGCLVASAGDVDGDGADEVMFSNFSSNSTHTVWVAKYTGTGVGEQMLDARYQMPDVRLRQNWPNPFTQVTDIRYEVRDSRYITLKIYDVTGSLVKTLVDKKQRPGEYTVSWDGKDDASVGLPSGVYFYQLEVRSQELEVTNTKKLVLVR